MVHYILLKVLDLLSYINWVYWGNQCSYYYCYLKSLFLAIPKDKISPSILQINSLLYFKFLFETYTIIQKLYLVKPVALIFMDGIDNLHLLVRCHLSIDSVQILS